MIKNIIFDLGGVLLNISLPNTMTEFKKLGIDVECMLERMKSSSQKSSGATMCDGVAAFGPIDDYTAGNVSSEDFIKMWKQLSRPGTTDADIINAWNSSIFDIPQYRLDFIKEMRDKGYKTYMLSNTNDIHWIKIVEDCPQLTSLFDGVFLSQEMHLAKPDPTIFKETLDRIGAPADECLFIDDSRNNTAVAAQYGIHTVTADVSKWQPDGTFLPPATEWKEEVLSVLSEE